MDDVKLFGIGLKLGTFTALFSASERSYLQKVSTALATAAKPAASRCIGERDRRIRR
jgi:hypothetical protein